MGPRFTAIPFVFWLVLLSIGRAHATLPDAETPDSLWTSFIGKVSHNRVNAHWTADGNAFWFQSHDVWGNWQYIWVDAIKGKRKSAFDASRLAASLQKVLGYSIRPECLPIDNIETHNGNSIVIDVADQRFSV